MSKRNAKSQYADREEGRERRQTRRAARQAKRFFVESAYLYSL
jgi:hypothetical protein